MDDYCTFCEMPVELCVCDEFREWDEDEDFFEDTPVEQASSLRAQPGWPRHRTNTSH